MAASAVGMKARRVREVQEILASAFFRAWYDRYLALRHRLFELDDEREKVRTDLNRAQLEADSMQRRADETLYEAGELEDRAASAHARFAEIENDSFESLSAFEMQRQVTTERWVELDRREKLIEDERQRASELRAQLEAARKIGSSGDGAHAEHAQLEAVESRIAAEARELERVRGMLAQDELARDELWAQVESAWSESFRANMGRAEYAYQARRARGRAEHLYGGAVAERQRLDVLRDALEALDAETERVRTEYTEHLISAERELECTLLEEFLYWPLRDDVRSAICVPLIEERQYLNIQIMPLLVYRADRARGLELLEPIGEGTDTDDDPRLESFFSDRPA